MNATQELHDAGQSLWLDNITRELLTSGTLRRYIDEFSITGLTSNPTIFHKAIKDSSAYDDAIRKIVEQGTSGEDLFFELAIENLTQGADLLRSIFDRTCGVDGWVSLEVSPLLAHDTQTTITVAKDLHARAGRSNLFIKIPGTKEGWRIRSRVGGFAAQSGQERSAARLELQPAAGPVRLRSPNRPSPQATPAALDRRSGWSRGKGKRKGVPRGRGNPKVGFPPGHRHDRHNSLKKVDLAMDAKTAGSIDSGALVDPRWQFGDRAEAQRNFRTYGRDDGTLGFPRERFAEGAG